jgi:hypothetical protein
MQRKFSLVAVALLGGLEVELIRRACLRSNETEISVGEAYSQAVLRIRRGACERRDVCLNPPGGVRVPLRECRTKAPLLSSMTGGASRKSCEIRPRESGDYIHATNECRHQCYTAAQTSSLDRPPAVLGSRDSAATIVQRSSLEATHPMCWSGWRRQKVVMDDILTGTVSSRAYNERTHHTHAL